MRAQMMEQPDVSQLGGGCDHLPHVKMHTLKKATSKRKRQKSTPQDCASNNIGVNGEWYTAAQHSMMALLNKQNIFILQ